MDRIKGSAIMIKVSGKFYAGVTDIDYSSSATVETSLIKEDDGNEQEEVTGFEDKLSLSGLMAINEGSDDTDHIDSSGIRAAYREKQAIPFVYGLLKNGTPEISGNMRLTSWSEKSGSSGYATWSCEAKIIQDDSLVFGTTVIS